VASSHPPLIGLVGRIGPLGRQGSHPGPMSFWALWPVYRLFGASWWAMQVSAVALHLVAMGTALWIAFRRGGVGLMLAPAAGLAAILWTPPVIDQIVDTPGNSSVLSGYFGTPPASPVGLRRAIDVFFVHLNPWHLVEHLVTADRTKVESGSLVPGALFITAW